MIIVDHTANLFGTELGSTLAIVGGMQALKKAKWFPLVQQGQAVLNRIFSIAAALCTTLAIGYTWNPANNGTLILTGISVAAIAHGLFHVLTQFLYQETGYTGLQGLQALQKIAGQMAAAGNSSAPPAGAPVQTSAIPAASPAADAPPAKP